MRLLVTVLALMSGAFCLAGCRSTVNTAETNVNAASATATTTSSTTQTAAAATEAAAPELTSEQNEARALLEEGWA